MATIAGVAARFSMLVDGLGRVRPSVLVAIDDDRSACCPVSRDPRKAYRSTGVAPAMIDGTASNQSSRQDVATVGC